MKTTTSNVKTGKPSAAIVGTSAKAQAPVGKPAKSALVGKPVAAVGKPAAKPEVAVKGKPVAATPVKGKPVAATPVKGKPVAVTSANARALIEESGAPVLGTGKSGKEGFFFLVASEESGKKTILRHASIEDGGETAAMNLAREGMGLAPVKKGRGKPVDAAPVGKPAAKAEVKGKSVAAVKGKPAAKPEVKPASSGMKYPTETVGKGIYRLICENAEGEGKAYWKAKLGNGKIVNRAVNKHGEEAAFVMTCAAVLENDGVVELKKSKEEALPMTMKALIKALGADKSTVYFVQ